jgi:hypothetical protein
MRVEAIHTRDLVRPLWGAAAELAEARKTHQATFPDVPWHVVMSEAQRIRGEQGLTLAQAIYIVVDRLSSGAWQPRVAA